MTHCLMLTESSIVSIARGCSHLEWLMYDNDLMHGLFTRNGRYQPISMHNMIRDGLVPTRWVGTNDISHTHIPYSVVLNGLRTDPE